MLHLLPNYRVLIIYKDEYIKYIQTLLLDNNKNLFYVLTKITEHLSHFSKYSDIPCVMFDDTEE